MLQCSIAKKNYFNINCSLMFHLLQKNVSPLNRKCFNWMKHSRRDCNNKDPICTTSEETKCNIHLRNIQKIQIITSRTHYVKKKTRGVQQSSLAQRCHKPPHLRWRAQALSGHGISSSVQRTASSWPCRCWRWAWGPNRWWLHLRAM